jgi:uncharacterized spore protein YtfJ
MKVKIKDRTKDEFDKSSMQIEKIANANTVVGQSIITVSGTQVIPLSSVTVVNIGGGGEYGDVKTFKEAEGFKLAGGNGTVVTVKPKAFLVDEGKGCHLLKIDDSTIDEIIDKTGQIIDKITDND